MNDKTIIIVDDNDEFRNSAEWRLESDEYQVQSFASPNQALAFFDQNIIENTSKENYVQNLCILMDVRMPEMSGLDLHDALQERGYYPPVIYMTGHGAVPLAVEAMKKGAVTFLEKPFDDAALQVALNAAFNAQYLSAANDKQNSQDEENCEDDERELEYQQRLAKLTPREREVLEGVVEGKLNKVIADKLDISIKTVEVYRARLIKKLEAKSLPEMVRMVVTGRV